MLANVGSGGGERRSCHQRKTNLSKAVGSGTQIVTFSQVDLTKRRVVDEGEGRLWAESRGFHYFETSAQSGEGINEMFQVCVSVPSM